MSAQQRLELRSANRRGIAAMALAMVSFVSNDALVKFVSQSLPATQLIFIRGVFATALLVAVSYAMGAFRTHRPGEPADQGLPTGGLRLLLNRPVLLRAAFDASASMIYLTSLFHLPLGNATAINMATPLFITLYAMAALGERVRAARWLAIGTGFAGVLMIVQPAADGFNFYALLCLCGTLLHTARDITTRSIPRRIPSILITLSTAVSVMLLSGALGIFETWKPVQLGQIGLLAAASLFLGAGYFLLVMSMRAGEMSLIAPFRYTGLLFALVLGWLVWGELPNLLAWAGIALLAGAGLYVLHDERSRHRADLAAAAE